MNLFFKKIYAPALLISAALVQSLGIDAGRAVEAHRYFAQRSSYGDSISPAAADSSAAGRALPSDTLEGVFADTLESVTADSTEMEINPADTIKVPDSLRFTDPLKFKYFIALRDADTRLDLRDSLIAAKDSVELALLDSLFLKDSAEVAQARFEKWYAGLNEKQKKEYQKEQEINRKAHIMDSIMAIKLHISDSLMQIKDSIRTRKDSIIGATPRILDTYVLPDSMYYKRILTWKHDPDFNNIKLEELDTSYNYHFNDYPFLKNDVGATYLGVIGSAVQTYNFFKREEESNVSFYSPYSIYSYSPATLPMYNTKTPYTELAYWGTLFSNKDQEESEIKILSTQNITPALNLNLEYHRYGGRGMLKNEDTDNRTCVISTNYLGKKYLMHAGYIYHKIGRSENGGVMDNGENGFNWIMDTTVKVRELNVHLADADNLIKKNTVFLDQSYRIPMEFLKKIGHRQEKLLEKARLDSLQAMKDSLTASGDTLALQAFLDERATEAELKMAMEDSLKALADSLGTSSDVTTFFLGHSSQYSTFTKKYTDRISASEKDGREFYNNCFFINPVNSSDSLRVMKLDNKVYVRLQPWSDDGIVSKIDAGIGDKIVNYYHFDEDSYLTGNHNTVWNSAYIYAGAQGQFKKYFQWDATGRYTLLGQESGDAYLSANALFSAYPFRRFRNSPVSVCAHFETSLTEPDYYQQHMFSNHFKWENDFDKISATKLQLALSIPHWKLKAEAGYALLASNIYYDTLAVVRQNTAPMSVFTASLEKDLVIGGIHLDNRILGQISSNQDVLPLPKLAMNMRYYYQFVVQRDESKTFNVMTMQIGANILWNTMWYAPGYNPALGVFYNQKEARYGRAPYMDAFVNVQWKRACIFVKYINANYGWPMDKADYFSAHHYIRSQRAVKFGIFWPFYVQESMKPSES